MNCQNIDPGAGGGCEFGIGGEICGYLTTYVINSDATCAPCAPLCGKKWDSVCATRITYYCKEHCNWLICACTCDPDLENIEPIGNHYICPD